KVGRRACINIGDQFLRSSVYGRYKIVPIHAEIIIQMEKIGFDFLGSIIWNKKTTMKTSGGATIMGSYPYPPNGIVEIDYEHILIFKKPGKVPKFDREIKEASKMAKEEWKKLHLSHWNFGGARQVGHEAMFPEELPARLIKMFSFVGDTVLDPFLGSGTTALAANRLGRNCIGYELSRDFIGIKKEEVDAEGSGIEIIERGPIEAGPGKPTGYEPGISDAEPVKDEVEKEGPELFRVRTITVDLDLVLGDGREIELMGIDILDRKKAGEYLEKRVKGKMVTLVEEDGRYYVYLRNRIFVNKELIKNGSAAFSGDETISKAGFLKKASQE
ncbi:MAG: DNA methyltransferase, partial [Candidatus Thermoplasmatota archaeon]|nr:DNA methyltransferase [Candidatus Thermoplasmatota archaeon]